MGIVAASGFDSPVLFIYFSGHRLFLGFFNSLLVGWGGLIFVRVSVCMVACIRGRDSGSLIPLSYEWCSNLFAIEG